jgi:tetratricopeptide (TPR) repeat protein
VLRFDMADALARLAEHSLLIVATGEPTRYRALETIRQFGAEQLDEHGRSETVHQRHRQWCATALALLTTQPRDDDWCERLDRLADDVRAAVARAADRPCGPMAVDLAERLAEQLLLRGGPHESQRCYEQAAQLADADAPDRPRLLRLAAGAAAARLVGKDTLRLLREAAHHALAQGNTHAAAIDLAWMVTYMRWAPGIVQDPPDRGTVDGWLDEAAALAGGMPAAEAAVAVATAFGLADDDPRVVAIIGPAVDRARAANAPLIESVALDCLCGYHTVRGELRRAIEQTDRRRDVLSRVALDASSAFQFNDCLLMASEVQVAAGNLHEAREAADRLAALACYRDYPHPALARRIRVDAMAGDFRAAVAHGDRFLEAWQSAGRPITHNINFAPYAMAMVHGLLGDEAARARWIELAQTLSYEPESLATCRSGWAPTFDALLALDRDDADAALRRLTADLDDASVWAYSSTCMWRPWYAALWAEAAVLGTHPEAKRRLERAAEATCDNAIAATIVQRAADLARGRRSALRAHAQTFADLGCDYQRRRTEALAVAT